MSTPVGQGYGSGSPLTQGYGSGVGNISTAVGIAELFLYTRLSGDTELMNLLGGGQVWSTLAGEGATWPAVVFAWMGGVDVRPLGTLRTMTQFRYSVRVIGQTASILQLDPILTRVDKVLQGAAVAFAHGRVDGCVRLNQEAMGLPNLGRQFRQIGNIYQLDVVADA